MVGGLVFFDDGQLQQATPLPRLSRGLITRVSFCTSCVMVWREATGDDEN